MSESDRIDGSPKQIEIHAGRKFFVLDPDIDIYAIPALRAYANACRAKYPALADDLDAWANEI